MVIEPDIDNADCPLCGGSQVVEIIPSGDGENNAVEEECPHCLRRDLRREIIELESELLKYRADEELDHDDWATDIDEGAR